MIHALMRTIEEGPLGTPTRALLSTLALWACGALLAAAGVSLARANGASEGVGELLYAALVGPAMLAGILLWPLGELFEALNLPTAGAEFGAIAVPAVLLVLAGYWISLIWLSWRSVRRRSAGAFLAAASLITATSPLLVVSPTLAMI